MQNMDLENAESDSRLAKQTDTEVPLWQLRAMISKLRARAAVLDQQISELEWTSQLDRKPGRLKPAKCQSFTIRRDTASIEMLRARFLPKTHTPNGRVPIVAHTHRLS